jgi:hypothetical protein
VVRHAARWNLTPCKIGTVVGVRYVVLARSPICCLQHRHRAETPERALDLTCDAEESRFIAERRSKLYAYR